MVDSKNKSKIAERASDVKTLAAKEEEILKFWKENKIFEKSLNKKSKEGDFVFYEGPPTANAKPALHHLEARAFKDIIPRYKTMRGFRVPRKGGWDTHGLPVELQVEKKLGLQSKKDIEKYGVAEFNKECKDSVFEYIGEWEKFTDRIGYWVDKENAYYTFNPSYIEAVWNVLKKVNDEKLLYKDYKVVPWCPRCGTALSSHELAQGYQDDKDLSVYVKFKLLPNQKFGENKEYLTGESAYILAWTTTPWTLPGNVALAISDKISYSAVRIDEIKELLIVATDLIAKIFADKKIEVVHVFKGEGLLDLEYEPLYPFSKEKFGQKSPESFEKAYRVYPANFVNTEDGTGIVHTAVMYGQDDFELGTKVGLPKFHLVKEDGHFFEDMDFLSNRFVKDEDVAVDIIKDLAHRNLLFKKEKYEHSYPHCWRCKTPLIYYARDSWYIKMSKLRDKLVKENEKINWVPAHIKEGRFGEWLREVKDWAISRERYWGTPLPIWQNEKSENFVFGSIDELKKHTKKSGNKYFALRHGQTDGNISGVINCKDRDSTPLNAVGKEEATKAAKKLVKEKIDLIISSPFLRARQTAEIVASVLDYKGEILQDERIREIQALSFDGSTWEEREKNYSSSRDHFVKQIESDENLMAVKRRVGEFLYELERKYENKNILIVSHGSPLGLIAHIVSGATLDQILSIPYNPLQTAEIRKYDFIPLPHNENYELDLHKPYIDQVELVDKDGNKLTRVKEVMDVWFDSGAMPFAQDGLVNQKEMLYPADFISEAIDQTRGWFYTLHAIGVLMNRGRAYKNVICLGHILDAEGKKMSKSVGNIVDPNEMMNKYGADALRMWMYTVNQPGDSKNFDEKTVDELIKKIFNPLENILSFYELYKGDDTQPHNKSKHILDRWILSSLNQLIKEGSEHLDNFRIFEAGRLVRDFVNDFSTWYIRRSRDRFKSENLEDRKDALSTTYFVLMELSKYLAPFTPFFAENLYLKLKEMGDPESVHLCDWPEGGKVEDGILELMEEARRTVSLALEKRMSAGVKVRQPLFKLEIRNPKLETKKEYLELIKDEVNVKEIVFDQNLKEEVELDTNITPELQKEGNIREIIRAIQELRKNKNLTPSEKIDLSVKTDEIGREFLNLAQEQIKKPTNIVNFVFEDNDGQELKIENYKLKIQIK